jgi:hypothetical protein
VPGIICPEWNDVCKKKCTEGNKTDKRRKMKQGRRNAQI